MSDANPSNSATAATLPYFNNPPSVAYSTYDPNTNPNGDPNGIITYPKPSNATDRFYHPFSSSLVSSASLANTKATIQPIENAFTGLTSHLAGSAFGTGASAIGADGVSHPTYSELSKPYTNYNWAIWS